MRSYSRLVFELGRALFGLTYLGGATIHIYLWATNRGVYAEITQFILFDWYRNLWTGLILPNLGILLPVLVVAEVGMGLSILWKERTARAGLLAGGLFNLCVAPLGFWWPTNVLLAAGHIALAKVEFHCSTFRVVQKVFSPDTPTQ